MIGAGVAGVTAAYELARRGYPTSLVEMRPAVALGTSYANGALLTPSMADPWNAPGVHRHLAASLLGAPSAVTLRRAVVPSLIGFGWRFLRYSTRARHTAATQASFLLGRYSLERTRELRTRLALEYDSAAVGSLKVFSTQPAMEGPLAMANRLSSLGLKFEVLDGDGAVAAEPALGEIKTQIAGALRFPDDEIGDARLFCEQLLAEFVRLGGVHHTNTEVAGIVAERGRLSGVRIANRVKDAEIVVVAAGNSSVRLVRELGLSLPIRPAKGYTVTFDAAHVEGRPKLPIVHDALHAAVVPIGNRLRLAGTAEFAGEDLSIPPERIENLLRLLTTLLPRVARQLPRAQARSWAGLRPMSADGLPFIGPSHIPGLYINTGHGHLGWTFAVGSAQLLSDLIEGKPPQLDPMPYRITR